MATSAARCKPLLDSHSLRFASHSKEDWETAGPFSIGAAFCAETRRVEGTVVGPGANFLGTLMLGQTPETRPELAGLTCLTRRIVEAICQIPDSKHLLSRVRWPCCLDAQDSGQRSVIECPSLAHDKLPATSKCETPVPSLRTSVVLVHSSVKNEGIHASGPEGHVAASIDAVRRFPAFEDLGFWALRNYRSDKFRESIEGHPFGGAAEIQIEAPEPSGTGDRGREDQSNTGGVFTAASVDSSCELFETRSDRRRRSRRAQVCLGPFLRDRCAVDLAPI